MLARLAVTLLIVSLAPATIGCEEDLPTRDDHPIPYSMFGVITPDLDTQSVRIYPLENIPTLGSANPLDVQVTSIDVHTNERHVWRDTVLVEANDQHEHVFWAPFRAEFGHAYRLEAVRGSDGASSWAEVRIPVPPVLHVTVHEYPVVELFVEGDGMRVLKPEARYSVDREGPDGMMLPLHTIGVSHEGEERRVENGWSFAFNITGDTDEVVAEYARRVNVPINDTPSCGAGLVLRRLELSVIVGDVAWDPPGGFLDPLILSQPKTLSNVENGFGFIGAGFRVSARTFPPRSAIGQTCLIYGL